MDTAVATWERIASSLADELRAARGEPARERAALARALAAYGRAHAAAGEPPFENAEHFFAVDGCVLDVSVTPAFTRAATDAASGDRWAAVLDALPRRLDALDALAAEGPTEGH